MKMEGKFEDQISKSGDFEKGRGLIKKAHSDFIIQAQQKIECPGINGIWYNLRHLIMSR